jgi:hypothetical protein
VNAVSTFAAFQLRPRSAEYEGLGRDRLNQIAEVAGKPGRVSEGAHDTMLLPPVSYPPRPDMIESIRSRMAKVLGTSSILIVDMSFPPTAVRLLPFESVVSRAITELAVGLENNVKIVLLVPRIRPSGGPLDRLATTLTGKATVVVVETAGARKVVPSVAGGHEQQLAQLARPTPGDLFQHIAARTLRRRSLFEVAAASGTRYAGHRYSLETCVAELATLLAGHFLEQQLAGAIVDVAAPPWLHEAVLQAGVSASIDTFPSTALDEPAQEPGLFELLKNADARIGVVLSLVKTGTRLLAIADALESLSRQDALFTSILVDRNEIPEPAISQPFKAAEVSFLGRDPIPLRYLFRAPVSRLVATDWQVKAAARLDEIEVVPNETEGWRDPSTVAMLMLLADYGTIPEPLPPSHRAGLESYPNVRALDEWDPYWIAWALLAAVEHKIHVPRRRMLILTPEDDTAAQTVGNALNKYLSVSVEQVPRDVLAHPESVHPELRDIIKSCVPSNIVLLDESAVSYTTLRQLCALVEKVTGEEPGLCAVLFDLPVQPVDLPVDVISLYGWSPMTQVAT